MTDRFNLQLDTAPPANPVLLLNSGAPVTGDPIVQVGLTTSDYLGGASDVSQMKLWGDVDLTADSFVQGSEVTSAWISFSTFYNVKLLSSPTGNKTIFAKIRDDAGNQTLLLSATIKLDLASPLVTITSGVSVGKLSTVTGYDTAVFTWQVNQAFAEYTVRAVPTPGSPYNAGVPIGATNGSLNVASIGSFPSVTGIVTTIKGADLALAAPGVVNKEIKVFARNSAGLWSQ